MNEAISTFLTNVYAIFAYTSRFRMNFLKEGGYQYKKAGVIVWNIVPDSAIQTNLFNTIDRDKQSSLAAAIDAINHKNGHNTIKVAVQDTTDKS